MTSYAQHLTTNKQTEKARADQVKNNAGGFVFAIDKWQQLDRFLILGASGGTYYVGERPLTRENAEVVLQCLVEDSERAVARIAEISLSGRAPKNDPAIFALALGTSHPNSVVRRHAYRAIGSVCRIGTHLFKLIGDHEALGGGWGRGFRTAIGAWYNGRTADKIAYQAIKYQSREGWSHRDVLRLAHPSPLTAQHDAVFRWSVKGIDGFTGDSTQRLTDLPMQIVAFEDIKRAESVKDVVRLIRDYSLPHECVPNEWKSKPEVWEALLEDMGATAMLRNLGKMTSIGLLQPLSKAAGKVRDALGDKDVLHAARVHPMNVLIAMRTYGQGHGDKGSLTWQPVRQVMDTLDDAFYLAFDAIEPTGKAHLLALDVSGSMESRCGGLPISCREASAAMAMAVARTEKNYGIIGFTGSGGVLSRGPGASELDISPKMRLDEVVRKISNLPFGPTDCALPFLLATHNKWQIDVFHIYTDNETWCGGEHPYKALQKYRKDSGRNAKSAVIGMTATGFTVADPKDPGMLDVVGMDSSVPAILADYARGDLGKTEATR